MSPPSVDDLAAYYDRLARHDWSHMMSEDYNGVVRPGASELASLRTYAKGNVAYQELFDAWDEYIWHRALRPKRPGGPSLKNTCIEEETV